MQASKRATKLLLSNRLEKLKGDLKDFYALRVNDQWRVIFKCGAGDAHEVRIVDCHQESCDER